jgi:hypothetical protein
MRWFVIMQVFLILLEWLTLRGKTASFCPFLKSRANHS